MDHRPEGTLSQDKHLGFLRRAIALSSRAGLESCTGGPFGAVITKDEQIVSEGMNRVVVSHDPTWHAEMEAIRSAAVKLQTFKLDACTLYSSAEPCPMCLAATYWAGIKTIYYAASVEDAALYGGFDDSFIYRQLQLNKDQRQVRSTQLLQQEAAHVWRLYQAKPNKIPY